MLGTTGNSEYFRIGSPILTFTGTTGNDRERPGTGEVCDGRFLGCEVKSATGRLRPEQTLFLERINGAGGLGFVARNCRDVFTALAQGP